MQVCPECENTLTFAEDEVEEGEVVEQYVTSRR